MMLGGEDLAGLFEQLMGGLMNEISRAVDPGQSAKQFILRNSVKIIDDAASEGDWNKARELLKTNPIFEEDGDKMTCNDLLLVACDIGKLNVVKLILERQDCNLNFQCVRNGLPTSPLSMACYFGHLDIVRLLLKLKGIKVNGFKVGGSKMIPLHEALGVTDVMNRERQTINVDVIRLLLDDSRVNVNELSAMGYTGLQMLVTQNEPATIASMKLMLAHKDTDVNLVTESGSSGWSALSVAISRSCIDTFRLLIKHKNINVNCVGKETWLAPLHCAVIFNQHEMVRELIQHKNIDVNVRMPLQMEMNGDVGMIDATPLYAAARNNYVDIVRLLLTHDDIDINTSESVEENTPLIIASYEGHASVVELLLNHKRVDINMIEKTFGKTAFSLACLYGHTDVVQLFLKSGHKLDISRVLKDFDNKEQMFQFFQRTGIHACDTVPQYTEITRLLDKHLAQKHRQPSRKNKSTKSKLKKQLMKQQAIAKEPQNQEEQLPIVKVEQPASFGSEKKGKTAEEKAEARARRQARRREEAIAFKELEMSLDTLD